MASDAIDSICSFIRQRYWADAATLNQVISLDCMLQVIRAALDPVLNLTGDPNDRSPVSPPPTVDVNETIRELKLLAKELVCPTLSEASLSSALCALVGRYARAVGRLPDPPAPKVDVLLGCQAAFEKEAHKGQCRPPDALRAALRRYLELRGLPKDPELE